MILLLGVLAWASPEAQVQGADLDAWEALANAQPPTTHALLHFISDWPQSPLAERAWRAARDQADLDPSWVRRNRRLVTSLERSLAAHEDNLTRSAEPGAVATIGPEGQPASASAAWWIGPRAGIAAESYGPAAVAGVHVGRGPLAAVARLQVGAEVSGELALRLQPASWRSAWASLGADTGARAVAQLGFATSIRDWLAFEAGGGVRIGTAAVSPVLRIELTTSLSRRR